MINKLRTKILLIVLLAISIPLTFIISFYTYSYYNNSIRLATTFIERIYGDDKDIPDNKRENEFNISYIDGMYSVTIKNGTILESSENITDDVKSYVKEIENKKTDSGIIGKYIYKKRKSIKKEAGTEIVLVESTDTIKKINLVITSSIIVLILGLILIYILAKRIAKTITKPVEDTLDKQITFISDASHELKTPLAVIQANADVLEGEIGDNKWLTYIQNETDNMSKLINEMLLLTKTDNINKYHEVSEFNISEEIEFVTSSFESMAFEKQINVDSKIEKNVITNKLNKEDIRHILSTLIDNAIKHTDKNNKVIVEMKKNKEHISIDVKNEGEPIPVSEREKIFERFYRIDKSRNRNEKRYGLGLAIAKSMVLKNNGTISVDCKNGYTIFHVALPL